MLLKPLCITTSEPYPNRILPTDSGEEANVSYAGGPRCTPAIDAGKLYTIGSEGRLLCLDAETGSVVWEKDLKQQYGIDSPHWGFSAHPYVQGEFLYCLVGGDGSVAVAFDKETGREVWRALSAEEPGYCPPTIIRHAGVRQLLIWNPESIQSLHPDTGEVYWSQPLAPNYKMSIAVPRKLGDLLFASGIGHVAAMFKLDDTEPDAEVHWRGDSTTAVYACNTTPFLEDGTIYGVDCHSGGLIAARASDGQRLWETFKPTTGDRNASHGTAFLVKHEDRFFIFNETGDLILAKLSPEQYEELGRFHVLDPTNECFGRDVVWSQPAFAEKCVFARNDKLLVCVDLASKR